MNDKQWQQVEAQLPEGTKILKIYQGYRNNNIMASKQRLNK